MTPAEIHAYLSARLSRNIDAIAVIGDSGTGRVVPALQTLLPNEVVENRGVGGTNMEQIATKFRTEQLWRSHVIVCFDLSGDTVSNNETYYAQLIADMRRPAKRFLFVQPGIAGDEGTGVTDAYIGGPFRATIEAQWQSVEDAAPNNYVPIMQALWDANDGSAGDLADVANGITPRSLREPADSLHPNDAGAAVIAAEIVAALQAKGWV